jgi:hypothetical protein
MARLESPLGMENGLVEPFLETHTPEGLYKDTTLVQDRREVPVRVLKATCHDQKLTIVSSPDTLKASHAGGHTRC